METISVRSRSGFLANFLLLTRNFSVMKNWNKRDTYNIRITMDYHSIVRPQFLIITKFDITTEWIFSYWSHGELFENKWH